MGTERLADVLRLESEKRASDIREIAISLQEECNCRASEVKLLITELQKERECRASRVAQAMAAQAAARIARPQFIALEGQGMGSGSSPGPASPLQSPSNDRTMTRSETQAIAERASMVEALVGKVQGEMDVLSKKFEASLTNTGPPAGVPSR